MSSLTTYIAGPRDLGATRERHLSHFASCSNPVDYLVPESLWPHSCFPLTVSVLKVQTLANPNRLSSVRPKPAIFRLSKPLDCCTNLEAIAQFKKLILSFMEHCGLKIASTMPENGGDILSSVSVGLGVSGVMRLGAFQWGAGTPTPKGPPPPRTNVNFGLERKSNMYSARRRFAAQC